MLSARDVRTDLMKAWKNDMKPYLYGVPSYAVMASAGLFVMMLILYFRCKDLSFHEFLLLFLFMAVGVGIGSKLLFVLTKFSDVVDQFSIVKTVDIIMKSGFVFYGGLFGAVSGLSIFAKVFRKDFKSLLNFVSIGFASFHACGRIGCFLAGCCYGIETDWGFPMSHSPEILRIPVQLIESICLIGIICMIVIVEKYTCDMKYSFEIYIGLYALCRFIIEFFRGDEVRGIWLGFSTSQWISAFLLFILALQKIKQAADKSSRVPGSDK